MIMDYERLFRRKEHYLTIPQIPSKKLFVNNRQVERLLASQKPDWDIYITKYPKDHCVSCIILDFDDKENPDNALEDVVLMKKFLKRKGLNTVIVQSGRKGYHAYIQIPCHNFVGGELAHANAEPNTWFKQYVKQLIGLFDGKYYQTLDEINSSAGLGSNIRLIGSKHPRGKTCEIISGEFQENIEPNQWGWDCFNVSKKFAEDEVTKFAEIKELNLDSNDIIAENDLQDVFEEVFGLELKRYNGYSYACCPFHDDKKPSMFLDSQKFSCNSCGAKGNIWTLIKKGYVKLEDTVRIGK